MSSSTATSNGPLSPEEYQVADRAVRRLHDELRSLLAEMPADARTASGLSRHLNVDRTTCQRAVSVAREPYRGPQVIANLPGIPGLRQVADAARDSADGRPTDAVLGSLEAAIDGYERLIQRLAGSQTKLVRRLSATPAAPEGPTIAQPQASGDGRWDAYAQQLFESAAELTGRYSEIWLAIYAYQPHPTDPDRLSVSRVYGLIGHRARADAVPLVIHNFSSPNRRADKDGPAEEIRRGFKHLDEREIEAGTSPEVVIPEFTSSPLPLVSSKQPGAFLVQSIDVDGETNGGPFDLILGSRDTTPHPRTQSPAVEETWAMINFPVRRLLFDVYLHQDLATRSIADLDVHLWRPDFASAAADRWQTRFARPPKLVMLGRGIDGSASPAYERHAELTRLFFEQTREDPEAFIGHRCEVTHPIWRTGYCMTFDFGGE